MGVNFNFSIASVLVRDVCGRVAKLSVQLRFYYTITRLLRFFNVFIYTNLTIKRR